MRKIPDKCLVAMIGLLPLPGSPMYGGTHGEIISQALFDLEYYTRAGVDAILIENSGDLPYIKPPLDEEALELVSFICRDIRARFQGPIGLQLLEAANEEALKIAAEADLDFIRVEGYVFAHIGGAGLIEGCAGKLHRLRRALSAEHIRIFGDIKKKHCSHAITADLDVVDVARQADFFKTDGHILTGDRTGVAPSVSELESLKSSCSSPVWIGSGMTQENIQDYIALADGFIVGSTFRKNGEFLETLDPGRLNCFVDKFTSMRCGL
ncbi:MAG: BtpA/SgcQ family protein [Opitutales bacterium]|nr:BtpA/SgcQ family protein [Opitutales bacterium]